MNKNTKELMLKLKFYDKDINGLKLKEFIDKDERTQELIKTNNFSIIDDFYNISDNYSKNLFVVDPATIIGKFKKIECIDEDCYIVFEINCNTLHIKNIEAIYNENPNCYYLIPRGMIDSKTKEIINIICFVLKRNYDIENIIERV